MQPHLFVTCLISHWASKRRTPLARDLFFLEHWVLSEYSYFTPFAVHYDKIRNHLLEEATNSAKIHSLARKYEHLRINQIQLRFLHFNQHSITLLGIHMRHSAYKREKYTFINANIKVINTILTYIKVQTLIHYHFYDTVCNSIAFLDNLKMDKTNINELVQSINKFWATQIFWAAVENSGKASF